METEIALLGSRLELLSSRIAALKAEEKPDSKGDAQAKPKSDSAGTDR